MLEWREEAKKDVTNERPTLTAIEAQLLDAHVAIPRGMKPIYLHQLEGGHWLAHVEGWTAEKEYDSDHFDLYLLSGARELIDFTSNGTKVRQEWFHSFGEPAKEALKDCSGHFSFRESLKAMTARQGR